MMVEKPDRPKGKHVHILRLHLGFTQTEFASLLRVAQARISTLENADAEKDMEPLHAARFLLLWDLFPKRPPGGLAEAMAILHAHEQGQPLPPGGAVDAESGASASTGHAPNLSPSLAALIGAATKLALTLNKAASLWLAREQLNHSKKGKGEPQGRRPPLYMRRVLFSTRGSQRGLARRSDLLTGFALLGALIVGVAFWVKGSAREVADRELTLQAQPPAPAPANLNPGPTCPQFTESNDGGIAWNWDLLQAGSPDGTTAADVNFVAKPVPRRPAKYQKRPPCDARAAEIEASDACYIRTDVKPPCGEVLYEFNGMCVRAIGIVPSPPVSQRDAGTPGQGSLEE